MLGGQGGPTTVESCVQGAQRVSHEPLASSGLVYMITVPSVAKVDLTGDTVCRTLLRVGSHGGPETLEVWDLVLPSLQREFQMRESSALGV